MYSIKKHITKNLNTYFGKERKEEKTFREIKVALKELLHDTKKENRTKKKTELIQKSKEKIENNIIENLKEGLKILSGDYLYPLKYLTTYNTIFNYSKNADNIIPGDILKLEGEKLVILRKAKKIEIGTITKKQNKKINNIENKKILEEVNKLAERIKKYEANMSTKNISKKSEKNLKIKEVNSKTKISLENLIPKNSAVKYTDIINLFAKKLNIKNNNGVINKDLFLAIKNIQNLTKDGIIGRNTIDDFIYGQNIDFEDIKFLLTQSEQEDYKNIISGKMDKKYSENINNIFDKISKPNFYKLTIGEIILISTLKKIETKK